MENDILTIDHFTYMDGKKRKLKLPSECASVLSVKTNLKYLKYFCKIDVIYLYDRSLGYYNQINRNELEHQVVLHFHPLGYPPLMELNVLRKVTESLLKLPNVSVPGLPIVDRDFLVFNNGVLNLKTRQLLPKSPIYFVLSGNHYEYLPGSNPFLILKFLREFCEGQEDRVQFLRAYLSAIVHSMVEMQVFLYILGPGGTGKSTLAQLAKALVGETGTLTTTLKALHSDQFEAKNIKGKKLILMSDTEYYRGDVSILKNITGNDAIRAREMYKQGSYEVHADGLVLIVGNVPLGVRDTTGALSRRMRVLLATHISKTREHLLTVRDGRCEGLFCNEIPYLLNWVLDMDLDEVRSYLIDTVERVPSLHEVNEENEDTLNPLRKWVREELRSSSEDKAYVGFKLGDTVKDTIEVSRRQTLYPTYASWAKRQGIGILSHIRFTNSLMDTLTSMKIPAKKQRGEKGIFIKGISIDPRVYGRDYCFGGPIIEGNFVVEKSNESNVNHVESKETPLLLPEKSSDSNKNEFSKDHDTVMNEFLASPGHKPRVIYGNLYERYVEKLGPSDKKSELNTFIRKHVEENSENILKSCLEEYFKDSKMMSKDYFERMKEEFLDGIKKVEKSGAIPTLYKQGGGSPRIFPVAYGQTINSTKRIIKDRCYEIMAGYAREQWNMCIIDFDLVSCYTSILLGLYPEPLLSIQQAIQSVGLWKYIESEFKKNNRGDVFNKPAVKICTYSSFFQGGNPAMIEGIMEFFRKDAGITQKEFKDLNYYEECHKIARDVTNEMQNSMIIADFRVIAEYTLKAYENEYLVGPSGHRYLVTKENFRRAYANWLQSYEIVLLSKAALDVVQKYPDVEIIGHFHDGNVLLIPYELKQEVSDYFSQKVSEIGVEVGLQYTQKVEIKKEYLSK